MFVIENLFVGFEDGEVERMVMDFESVKDLSDKEVEFLSGFCWLIGNSEVDDDELNEVIEKKKGVGIVGDLIDGLKNDSKGFVDWSEEYRDEIEMKEVWGYEVEGFVWSIEYDGSVGVMVEGNWEELRKEVSVEMVRRGMMD